MTSRERVIAAIEFSGPDRLPHGYAFPGAIFDRYPDLGKLLRRFPSDFAGEEPIRPDSIAQRPGKWKDEWGCVWRVPRAGFSGQVVEHPLSNWSSLKSYCWPNPHRMNLERSRWIAQHRGDKYVALGVPSVFQRMIALCGFENLMLNIATGAPELLLLRDRIVSYSLVIIDRLLKFNPDGIGMGDDWGSQESLFIHPSAWREIFLPAYKTLFARIREAGKHVGFHSDGYTMEILPELVEAGVNWFWVDLTVNGLSALRERLAGRVCFKALPDVQFVLREGTPEEVKAYAKDLIAAFGTFNGGFIACSELQPDQPWENIVAILETFHEYGRYPLKLIWAGTGHKEIL